MIDNAAIYDEVRFLVSGHRAASDCCITPRMQSWTGYASRPESVIEKS